MSSRKINRREFLRLAGITGAAAALAACAPPAAPSQPAAEAPAADATEAPKPTEAPQPTAPPQPTVVAATGGKKGPLTLWGWGYGTELITLGGKEKFEEMTGIGLEYTEFTWGNYLVALKTAIPAGSAPDLFQVDWAAFAPFASSEILLPLEDMAVATWGDWKKMFYPALVKETELQGTLEGKGHVFYMPCDANFIGNMWYSMPIFEKNGLKEPTTWAELEATWATLKEKGVVPLAEGKDSWRQVDLFGILAEHAAPGKLDKIQDGDSSVKFTDEDMIGALALEQKMVQDGVYGPNYTGQDFGGAFNLLINEQAGSMWLASFMFPTALTEDPKTHDATLTWKACPIPETKALVAAGNGVVIPKPAKQQELAWEYVKWHEDTPGGYMDITAENRRIPGNTKFKFKPIGNDFDKNVVEPTMKQLADEAGCRFRHIRCPGLYDALGPVMQGINTGQLTPQAGAEELQKAWDKNCVM